jgi:signal transduction histidine kinase
MKSTRALFREQIVSDLLRLSVIWLVGLAAIILTTQFLRRRIAERQQLEQQLRQSQKMEAIGQFAGGVAHDFNNLLQVINTFGFLIEGQLKENSLPAQFVEEQRVAIKRATSLTKTMLSFGRRQVSEPMLQDINLAVEEAHKLLRYITAKNVLLTVELQPDELQVCVDEGQMYQVLMNLVANARDAMPEGGQIVIATSRVNPDSAFRDRHGCNATSDFALLSVIDTGHGMDLDCLAKIFEPFYTTKADGKGTGLGLSVSYGIIQQHQGIIEVDSTPGEGTTFRIFLPLAG